MLLISPLSLFAGDKDNFVFIFNKYNEALKLANIQEIEKYLVNMQVSILKECLADSICGKSAIEGMKNGALSKYTITNFVKYAKDGRITQILDKKRKIDKVSGPAAQLYYEGVEVSGHIGEGDATFVIEDGIWKISMTSWGSRK